MDDDHARETTRRRLDSGRRMGRKRTPPILPTCTDSSGTVGCPRAKPKTWPRGFFVIAYERIHEIEELTTIGGWLRGIALRVVASHRRWRRVRAVKDWMVRVEAPAPKAAPGPYDLAEGREQIEQVRGILNAMKPKLREALVLCDLSGLDVAEAAQTLKAPVNTVRSRRRLAREQFGRLWRQRYGEHR